MPADQLRNRTVGSKMTESEYEQLVAVAEHEGLTLGEWCREVLLAHANSSDLRKPSATEQTLLAEFVALRMILLNALSKIGQGSELSERDLQVLTERADQERFSRARRAPCGSGCWRPIMSQEWGRNKNAGVWPNRHAVWTWTAVFLALVSMVAVCAYRYTKTWTPLQRFYLKTYIRSGLRSVTSFAKSDRYQMLTVVRKKGSHWAAEGEVTEVKTASGETTLALTDDAVKIGDLRLVLQQVTVNSGKLHELLGHWVLSRSDTYGLSEASVVGWLGGVFSVPRRSDSEGCRACPRAEGRSKAQGTRTCHAASFQSQESLERHRLRADGKNVSCKNCSAKCRALRLPLAIEPNHILIMGDTGTGKSTLIRRILQQIEERGETAIVYDPALDYTPEFYKPERGDAILNPLDQRMPYWSPGDELLHPAEALTLATSLFPDRRNENPFFVEGPRKIFAHLLTFRPTPEEMAWWMCHEEEIDQTGERHTVRGDDRPAGTSTAERRAGVAQHGCRLSQIAAVRKRSERTVERGGMVESNARVGYFSQARPRRANGSYHSRVCGSTRWCCD